jgi:uncharacterized membrane protein YraQ (UPF0718 family)
LLYQCSCHDIHALKSFLSSTTTNSSALTLWLSTLSTRF